MTSSSQRWTILTIVFAFAVVLLTTLHVAAQDRAVDLEVFIAEPTANDQIELFFETGSEEDTASFFFIRGASESDPIFVSPSPTFAISVTHNGVEKKFVPAEGGTGSGATYDAFDTDVQSGQQYCYMIGELELDGSAAYFLDDIRCVTGGDVAFTQLTATMSDLNGNPGDTVTHMVQITNEGNRDQQFIITVPNSVWSTTVVTPIIFIQSGQSVMSQITVEIPNAATSGDFDTSDVRITLNDNPNQPPALPDYTYTTTVTTRAGGGIVYTDFQYVPIIIKDSAPSR